MALGEKLGKLSLAILDNFVESKLGKKFVDELRAPTDRAVAVATALEHAEERFRKEFGDQELSQAMFIDLPPEKVNLGEAVGKFYDHPTNPNFRDNLERILMGEFKELPRERIGKAVDFYIEILKQELALADEGFSEKIQALAGLQSVVYLKKLAENSSSRSAQGTTYPEEESSKAGQKVAQVELVLEGEISQFSQEKQEDLVSVLSALLGVEKSSIRILRTYAGSIVVILEMETRAAYGLFELFERNDSSLRSFRIKSISLMERERRIKWAHRQPDAGSTAKHVRKRAVADRPDSGQVIGNTSSANIHVTGNVSGSNIIAGNENIVNQNIYQTVQPEKTLLQAPHQLPPAPPDFIGRENLITQILNELEKSGDTAILALTGMGGIGKTALGLTIAHSLEAKYPDGQIFIDLKGTTTSPLSPSEILRSIILSIEPIADLHALNDAQLSTTLQSLLYQKRCLLFLDNARDADQIAATHLPASCVVLITSRWQFAMPGLRAHQVSELSEREAADFLLELCKRIDKNAIELARACGYLPLALRIAGSFLQVNLDWPVENYLARLNEERQRLIALRDAREEAGLTSEADLMATFELSYQQLNQEQQERWRRLGIFPTSFTAQVAGYLWRLDDEPALKLLGLLRRYSMLDYDESTKRYHLHDLLAEFALTHMNETEERQARVAHAVHYWQVLNFATELVLRGNDMLLQGLKVFDLERDNIRAGQHWAVNYSEYDTTALDLCVSYPSLSEILSLRLRPAEYIQWIESGLVSVKQLGNKEAEAGLLVNLGLAHSNLGDPRQAINAHEQALTIGQEMSNPKIEATALNGLGMAYKDLGETHRSIEYYEQALLIVRPLGDRRAEGSILGNLGIAYKNLGDIAKSTELYKEALSIAQETGNRRAELASLSNLGTNYDALKRNADAIKFNEEALVLAHEIGDGRTEGAIMVNLGLAYKNSNNPSKALELFERALAISQESGDRIGEAFTLGNLGIVWADLGDPHKALAFHKRQLRLAREIGDRASEGKALANSGATLYQLGQREEGVKYIRQALKIFEAIDSPIAHWARDQLKQWGAG